MSISSNPSLEILLNLFANRVRDRKKMLAASRAIDRLRKRAPAGWSSVDAIRTMRDSRYSCS